MPKPDEAAAAELTADEAEAAREAALPPEDRHGGANTLNGGVINAGGQWVGP